jgi:DNA-binding LacI/PurR family transcriptional regulator
MDKGKIKLLFKLALCGAGLTMSQWARDRGVSHCTVSLVLSGRAKSARLSKEIARFTKAELAKLKIQARVAA